jgi:hypothetical protein
MLVGVKAMATLSTGYLNALEYARERLQGPDLTRRGDRSAPDVPIVSHPDVRRSLLTQKAYAEGLRALALFTACWQDERTRLESAGLSCDREKAVNDLLLPVLKGFASERAYELLAESLQTFGGSGYLQDYPVEQYIRDSKIDTIYEGTTAIQGLDLFFRKVVRDEGRVLDHLLTDIEAFCDSEPRAPQRELRAAAGAVRRTVALMRSWQEAAADQPKELYRVGLNATRLLTMLGEVVVGWLLARSADIAERALDGGASGADRDFYLGKVAVARFFAETRLPLVPAEAGVAAATGLAAMDIDPAAL